MNESLRQQVSSKDLSSKLTSQPISDIGGAMGLNESFHLSRNFLTMILTNSLKHKYSKTALPIFNEAYSYLNVYFQLGYG